MKRKIACLLCSCWFLAGLVYGQDDLPADKNGLSKQTLEIRIAEIESDNAIGDSLKEQLLAHYRQALAKMETAAQHKADGEEYKLSVDQAPLEAQEIHGQLEKESETPSESPEPKGATVKDLEALLAMEQVKQADSRSRSLEIDARLTAEQDRPAQLQEQMTLAQQKLEAAKEDLKARPEEGEDPQLTVARKAELEARRDARIAEILMLEQEQLSRPARLDLLSAKNELAQLRLKQADARVLGLQEAMNKLRREEVERVRDEAEQAEKEAQDKHPVLSDLASKNAELGRKLAEKNIETETVTQDIKTGTQRLDQVNNDFETTRDRLAKVGLNQVLSKVLLKQRNELPDENYFRKRDRERRKQIADGDVERITYEDELSDLADLDAEVKRILDEAGKKASEGDTAIDPEELKSLLAARADLLTKVCRAYDVLMRDLVALDILERTLHEKTEVYADFLSEKLLWIASVRRLDLDTLPSLRQGVLYLASPESWYETLVVLGSNAWKQAVWSALVILVFIALVVFRRKFRHVLKDTSGKVGKVYRDGYMLTVKALAATILMALPSILLLFYFSWLLLKEIDAPEFARAVGGGLLDLGQILSLFLVLYHICRPGGVAIAHFKWPEEPVLRLRRSLWALLVVLLPAVFVISVIEDQNDEMLKQSLGRLAFIAAMISLSFFLFRILRARGGVTESYLRSYPEGWVSRLRLFWYPAAVGFPLVLAVLSGLGNYYAARQLGSNLFQSIYLLTLVLVLYYIVMRWIIVAQRRMALAKARERRRADRVESDAEKPPAVIDERELDASTISAQSRHLVRVIAGFAVIVGFWLIWEDVLPALGILDELELWHYTVQGAESPEEVPITVTDLLLTLLVVIMTMVAMRNLPGALEIVFLRRLPLDAGSRYAITTICRYVIVGVGVVVTFSKLGMQWSNLQWLVAALSVGLGFGLQEIFGNFVSGLIILFERPVRVGDTVTVNGVDGTVSRIRIRATTITDWDRKELIIPNKNFITGDLINWTLSDPIMRLKVSVGIAYGSDTALAYKLLLEEADSCSTVLKEPSPSVLFLAFGESSLNFELRVYIRGINNYLSTKHELNMAIDQAFRKNGIVIAFPQHDLHVCSVDRPLPIMQVPYEKPEGEGKKT